MTTPILELRHISKRFDMTQALDDVSLSLYPGEIHALVGENGAGKSTLIKVLTGIYPPDAGEIFFEGRRVDFKRPRDARDAGIEAVYQSLDLVNLMSIGRNFFLGRELHKKTLGIALLDMSRIRQECREVLKKIGIRRERSPDTVTAVLSGGERQAINIGRAMYFKAKLIILDEPTTALSVKETEIVLKFIDDVKNEGTPVIFITHNIYHVYQVADRFVILDRGVKVADLPKAGVTPEDIMHIIREGKILDEAMTGPPNQAAAQP